MLFGPQMGHELGLRGEGEAAAAAHCAAEDVLHRRAGRAVSQELAGIRKALPAGRAEKGSSAQMSGCVALHR